MERAPPTDRGPFLLSLLIAVLLVPAALGSSQTIFNDGDVSWHIATGQWILDHRAIPGTDPFSFTWAGKPWVPIEWGAEVSCGGLSSCRLQRRRRAGDRGADGAPCDRLSQRRAVRPAVGAVGAIVAMDLVLMPMMLARPHVLTWPLLALWTWLMMRARERDRAPPLAAALADDLVGEPPRRLRVRFRWSPARSASRR